jgi:hypothetical protein
MYAPNLQTSTLAHLKTSKMNNNRQPALQPLTASDSLCNGIFGDRLDHCAATLSLLGVSPAHHSFALPMVEASKGGEERYHRLKKAASSCFIIAFASQFRMTPASMQGRQDAAINPMFWSLCVLFVIRPHISNSFRGV